MNSITVTNNFRKLSISFDNQLKLCNRQENFSIFGGDFFLIKEL